MNRRQFIRGIGAFMILPGAGRLWKATRPELVWRCNQVGFVQVMQQIHSNLEPTQSFSLNLDEMFDLIYAIRKQRELNQ